MSDQDKFGFTLLEILASILILTTLSLLSIAALFNLGTKTNLKSSTDQAANLLRLARQKAITLRIKCIVEIDPTSDQMILTQDGVQVEKIWNAPPGVDLADVSGNNNPTQLTFYPKGTATNRSIHFIRKGTQINGSDYNPSISYSAGIANTPPERVKCRTITTDNVTGRVRVLDYGLNTPWGTSTF